MKRVIIAIFFILSLLVDSISQEANTKAKDTSKEIENPTHISSEQESKDSPSLKETLDWLNDQLSHNGYFKSKQDIPTGELRVEIQRSAPISFDSCTLKWTNEYSISSAGRMSKHSSSNLHSFVVPLADINTATIKVTARKDSSGQYDLLLYTVDNMKTINSTFEMISDDKKISSYSSLSDRAGVLLNDEGIAKRAAVAFKHAIELCGGRGKKEPF